MPEEKIPIEAPRPELGHIGGGSQKIARERFHCIVSIVSIVSILCIISILSILSFFTFLQSLRFAFALVSSSQFQSIRSPWRLDDKEPYFSSFFLELQLTIFTLSALTNWPPLSSLKVTLRIRKVQTSSQKR